MVLLDDWMPVHLLYAKSRWRRKELRGIIRCPWSLASLGPPAEETYDDVIARRALEMGQAGDDGSFRSRPGDLPVPA
ncbi:hypothetical protein GCM10010269_70910 [Streptomyces humidus]|uniref:Uncharacterized protein n=1 Tax=Streptomyces humidus TaxID=52259 RepID=A0A918G7F2_9ACTN|nr:hypothetical protein [Streptomyces humidus]GGS21896.1 hypothetical protein GCM10010269_70910 [Streptomyces humidus]